MSYYASAEFTDSDAGAGEGKIESLSEFVNIDVAIDNLVQATSNIVERSTDGYFNKLKDFRYNLQKLCTVENLKLLDEFLDPEREDKNIITLIDMGKKLNNELYNSSSAEIFKNLIIDTSGSIVEYKDDIGCDYDVFFNAIHRLNEIYKNSLEELFQADRNLNSAIEGIQFTFKKVNLILDLDINDATSDIYVSLSKYIVATFSNLRLKELFDKFIAAKRKFIHYRLLLSSNNSIKADNNAPLCSICISEVVTHALVGCGHTYCMKCSRKQLSQCYICRCKIKDRVKIYFG